MEKDKGIKCPLLLLVVRLLEGHSKVNFFSLSKNHQKSTNLPPISTKNLTSIPSCGIIDSTQTKKETKMQTPTIGMKVIAQVKTHRGWETHQATVTTVLEGGIHKWLDVQVTTTTGQKIEMPWLSRDKWSRIKIV